MLTNGLQGHENANWPDSHGHVVSPVRGLVPGELSGRCVERMCGGRGSVERREAGVEVLCEGMIEGVPSRKGKNGGPP